ncbi:galactose-binding like protein [Clavulina sp. PMI_390]|nr:galactose-binding like protein [Clavulina sp. PMI_390]
MPVLWEPSLPDIGHLANWMVSSHKLGFDASCLQDDDPDTFWQSDGPQPHSITLQFMKKVLIQKLAINLNIVSDDSYTPIRLLIRAGTSLYDLQDVKTVSFDKPMGWIPFDIGVERAGKDSMRPLNVYVVQIIIAANHMNGKDTHVRGLKVLGAKEARLRDDDLLPFTSMEFRMHEFVR